jgi:hypothetical protein
MHHKLVIDQFDGVSVRDATGRQLPISSIKARALLGYLSFRPDLLDTRERIVGLLWSESSEEKARVALRQCLRQLKMALGTANEACLSVGRQHIGLTARLAVSRAFMIEAGIKSILCYAPITLNVPKHIRVEYIDPVVHFQHMTFYLEKHCIDE